MSVQSLYLRFDLMGLSATGKTEVWAVCATRSDIQLGRIVWFARWRQYAFSPEPGTVYNTDCLREIANFTAELTRLQRTEKPGDREGRLAQARLRSRSLFPGERG